MSAGEAKHDEQQFHNDRVSQLHGRGDDTIESRPVFRRNDVTLQKLPHDDPHSLMHDQFRGDEQRQ